MMPKYKYTVKTLTGMLATVLADDFTEARPNAFAFFVEGETVAYYSGVESLTREANPDAKASEVQAPEVGELVAEVGLLRARLCNSQSQLSNLRASIVLMAYEGDRLGQRSQALKCIRDYATSY